MHDATCCYSCSLPACLVKPCADVPHSHALQLCWKVSCLVTRALLLFVVLLCMSLKMHASSLRRWPCFRGLTPLGGVGTGARLTPSSPTLAPIAGLQCCALFAFMVSLRLHSWLRCCASRLGWKFVLPSSILLVLMVRLSSSFSLVWFIRPWFTCGLHC